MFIQPIFKRPGILFLALFITLGSITAWVMDLGCPSALFHCRRTSCEAVPPPPPPAVATAEKANYGPYMEKLQRQLKRSWFPPKGEISQHGSVLFKVNRDGSMTHLRVLRSTGAQPYDQAMVKAVVNASPFQPLPDKAPANVDIEFTFDYNVFSGQGQNHSHS